MCSYSNLDQRSVVQIGNRNQYLQDRSDRYAFSDRSLALPTIGSGGTCNRATQNVFRSYQFPALTPRLRRPMRAVKGHAVRSLWFGFCIRRINFCRQRNEGRIPTRCPPLRYEDAESASITPWPILMSRLAWTILPRIETNSPLQSPCVCLRAFVLFTIVSKSGRGAPARFTGTASLKQLEWGALQTKPEPQGGTSVIQALRFDSLSCWSRCFRNALKQILVVHDTCVSSSSS